MNPRDPGVQPERTALAWGRTGLAVTVNALLVLRAGLLTSHPFLVALSFMLLLAALGAIVCGAWRSRLLSGGKVTSAPPPALMAATVMVAWVTCAAGLASLVLAR